MNSPPVLLQVVLVLVVIVAAVYDVRFRRIPNWLVVSGLVLGLALNAFLFEDPSVPVWGGLRHSLLGLILGFVVYFPLYMLRGIGAGDVKLMAAIGSIVGAANWLAIFLVTALLGGFLAFFLLLGRGRVQRALGNIAFLLGKLATFQAPYVREELDVASPKSMKLPHALVIAGGCLLFLGAVWIRGAQ